MYTVLYTEWMINEHTTSVLSTYIIYLLGSRNFISLFLLTPFPQNIEEMFSQCPMCTVYMYKNTSHPKGLRHLVAKKSNLHRTKFKVK